MKKLTFNQFKKICLNDIIKHRKRLGREDGEYKSETEISLKDIEKDFKNVNSYDDIREIYGEFGLDETDIIFLFTRLTK